MQEYPAIGTKMYLTEEHRYYIPNRTGPTLEYCVCEAEIKEFYEVGTSTNNTYVKLRGISADGIRTIYDYKLRDIGKYLFYTPREAALYAQFETKRYERIWGWLGIPDIPMRRTWIKYF